MKLSKWDKVCNIANKFNNYLDNGCILINSDGEIDGNKLIIDNVEGKIYQKTSESCSMIIYYRGENIADVMKYYSKLKAIHPSNMIKVNLVEEVI